MHYSPNSSLYIIAILATSLNFSFLTRLTFFIFSVLILFFYTQKIDDTEFIHIKSWILLIPLVFLFLTRVLPFFLYGHHPLGYDTGIYNFYITSPFVSFPNQPIKGLGLESIGSRILIDTLRVLDVSPAFILYGIYIASSLIIGVLIYLIVKEQFSKNAAFFSLFFYSVSMVQFTMYHAMLWKNMVALVFFLSFVYFFNKNKTKHNVLYAFLFALLTIFMHRTTAIMLLLGLFVYLIVNFKKDGVRRSLMAQLLILSAIFIFLNYALIQNVFPSVMYYFGGNEMGASSSFVPLGEGSFISLDQYLALSFIILPLALLSFCFLRTRQNILFYIFGTSASFVIFHLYFYKRVLIYFDIMAVMLAGIAFATIFQKFWYDSIYRYAMVGLLIALLFIALQFAKNQQPMVTEMELQEIINLQNTKRNATVITLSSYYGPWIYGFSKRDTIAPGLFEDHWNHEQWKKFWFTNNQEVRSNMLSRLPRPLYIFEGKQSSSASLPKNCLENFSPLVKKYICD